uniref:Uncharacterized protein n=1 Tax=Arundo donax TaxID=35708 RepID=A0A0A9BQY0_ARUDO
MVGVRSSGRQIEVVASGGQLPIARGRFVAAAAALLSSQRCPAPRCGPMTAAPALSSSRAPWPYRIKAGVVSRLHAGEICPIESKQVWHHASTLEWQCISTRIMS